MKYTDFVKSQFPKMSGSAPERMKKIAAMWQNQKKGGGMDSFDGDNQIPIGGKSCGGVSKSVAGKIVGGVIAPKKKRGGKRVF